MKTEDIHNLYQRFIWGIVIVLALFFSLTFAHLLWVNLLTFVVVSLSVIVALKEFMFLTGNRGVYIQLFMQVALLSYFILYYAQPFWGIPQQAPIWLLLFFSLLIPLFLYYEANSFVQSFAPKFLGFIYLLIPFSYVMFFLQNSYFQPSRPYAFWLLFTIFVTKASDIGGLIVGKLCGKYPLAPTVSPTKTLEGFWGGVSFSAFLASLFYFFNSQVFSSFYEASLLGLALSFLGQWGDLTESMLKRETNVKDSNSLSAFGGALDMLDSLTFSLPFLSEYVRLWHGL